MSGKCSRWPIYCISCRAPKHELITRRIKDPMVWALDIDLADDFPDVWGPPHRVRLNKANRCETCSRPLGWKKVNGSDYE